MAERALPAGIMPDYMAQLPEFLKRNAGKWVWHEYVAPGVIKHSTADGSECITVRIQLPPNGLVSAATLRRLATWIKRYALVGRRTSRQGFEFVGVYPERLRELLTELEAAGYPAGGTGNSFHQVKGCTSYVHCQNAAIDAPSIMKLLAEHFYDDIIIRRYPARLKLSVSGCPNQCGSGIEADIGVLGICLDVPRVDDSRLLEANPDIGLLSFWCPTGAIRPKPIKGGMSVIINEERCVRCTSCVQVAPDGISMGEKRGAAVTVGGYGGNARKGPRLGRVIFPYVPVKPLEYGALISVVERIVETWVQHARPDERLGDYIERVGWPAFMHQVGAEMTEELIDDLSPEKNIKRDLRLRPTMAQ